MHGYYDPLQNVAFTESPCWEGFKTCCMLKLRLLLSTLIIGLSRPYETNGRTESGRGAVTSSSIFATATATWSTQLPMWMCYLLQNYPNIPKNCRNESAWSAHTLVSNVSIPKHHMGDSSLLRGATVQLCILPIIGDCFEVRKMALHSEKNQHALTKVVEFLVFAHFLQAFQGNPKHPETHPQLHHMAASASSRSCCCRRISISAFCTRASRLAARSGFL